MTSVGRFIPIYDAWSNEGGGRAIEEATRLSERAMLERMRPKSVDLDARFDEKANEYRAAFAAAQSAFVARYGSLPLNADGRQIPNGQEDSVALSAEAEAMLTDLSKLETKRVSTERFLYYNEMFRELSRGDARAYEGAKAGVESRQNLYDARFERDDEKRADAYERAQAAGKRLEELGARAAELNAQSVKRAAELAASRESSAALFASTKLFEFGRNGAVRIDASALANMGTTEAATAELARLIGALAERNGLGQLRDALIGAINGQNRRIAGLTAGV
ncbi:MAG: hypothetical protein ACKO1J_14520 [Tagaea sp.]